MRLFSWRELLQIRNLNPEFPRTEFKVASLILLRRLVARFIDVLVVFTIQLVLVIIQVFWFMDSLSDRFDPQPWGRSAAATFIYVALFGAYEIFFHTKSQGQTPGKIFMRIKVAQPVPVAQPAGAQISSQPPSPGQPPSFWRALVRWPLVGVPLPLLFVPNLWIALGVWLAVGVTCLFSRQLKAIHDYVAGTEVVMHEPTKEELEADRRMRQRQVEFKEKYQVGRWLRSHDRH